MLGPLLGSGEFCSVYELASFRLADASRRGCTALSPDEAEGRLHMKKHEKYRDTDNARYAVKHIKGSYLKRSLKNQDTDYYVQAAG